MSNPIVSLCMPTNGIVEWVFPVLDSIYEQNCDNDDFEIVITDNGKNKDFKAKIKAYNQQHSNLHYFETNALPFINEIESYKRAKGQLIKFVNHRTLLVDGALKFLITLAKDNSDKKPIIYFANGVLKKEKKTFEYDTFDQFVKNLSYWSSWSTGMTIWKEDFDKLSEDISSFNELFPHTNVLFAERNREKYIIDNTMIFDEIPQGEKPKGNYNIFYAFGIEYPSIILELYRNKSISVQTFKSVIKDNLTFIAHLYISYFIKKEYCSYDLSGLDDMYEIFYTKRQLKNEIMLILLRKAISKVKIINKVKL
ncbi:MAG: hypothetical protein JTJ28_08870 [Lactobacillus sp.]|nr:hypothetical protein [Lactobacillus sp.]